MMNPDFHAKIGPAPQRGMALVFSLLILLILSLLGVSSLRTSALEQLMSGNTQEMVRAFTAADSGAAKSRQTMPRDVPTYVPETFQFDSMNARAVAGTPQLLQYAQVQRSSKVTGYNAAEFGYYDQVITGTTGSALNPTGISRIHQGLKAPKPKDNYSP